jgi:hypothetical protein
VTCFPFAETHLLTAGMSSDLPPLPSTERGLMAPSPSHFTEKPVPFLGQRDRREDTNRSSSPSSLPQFFTRLLGQTMIAFSIVGLPAVGDWRRSVWRRAMHWSVLPGRACNDASAASSYGRKGKRARTKAHLVGHDAAADARLEETCPSASLFNSLTVQDEIRTQKCQGREDRLYSGRETATRRRVASR